jgi:hypothetical protein
MDFDSLMKQYQSSSSSSTSAVGGGNSSSQQYKRQKRQSDYIYIDTISERPKYTKFKPPTILVLVCAGPNSLHDHWFQPEEIGNPRLTIGIIWYGKDDPEEKFIINERTKVVKKQGPKWVLVRYALNEIFPKWKEEFDYIWIPDDDLEIVHGSIFQLVDVMASFDLDLAQPCLTDKNITSLGYRSVVLKSQNTRAVFHRTNCKS